MDLIQAYQDEESMNSKTQEEGDIAPQPVLRKMHVDLAPSLPVNKQVRNWSI